MLAIKNNLMAANAARHLGQSYQALATSVERLSSGLRINRASDDAAGLAVRELMRADIAVLQQGARNAQDGLSMLQTMEGGMQTIDDLLVRMTQLAEQAATGVYSQTQRSLMNNELSEIASEIDRIAGSTDFNGISMLNNSATVSIHFGGATDTISIVGKNMDTSGLGLSGLSIGTAESAVAALTTLNSAIQTANTNRADFGAKMNRMENTVELLQAGAENLQASESRISDVDVAAEMAALTRNQVLAQAGVSMLAQANAIPQMALTLLR
ncbi:MAG: flagellin [Sedimentisphaerales bacterium]|jgi:flagellin|nr:flagellin [Sedimentisphaerales bacterium]HNY79274.1 flagellin [Sedimentisphaerales bacterium]HOC64528.1 flagellin [Sedimentisphaerales bacterium]HOH63391.1 flagellin [Sedimentisphaerales bacterium]HPY48833.1 flagellin [Sedimentisphaerales bacterium]